MKIGPVEFEPRVSLTSVLTLAMALIAMVGGWYKFDYRISVVEGAQQELQDDHKSDVAAINDLRETLSRLNVTLGRMEQRLEDEDTEQQAGRKAWQK
jgi:hypothetical protein